MTLYRVGNYFMKRSNDGEKFEVWNMRTRIISFDNVGDAKYFIDQKQKTNNSIWRFENEKN